MSIFETLEQKILGFIKDRIHLGSLTTKQVQELCDFQLKYLKDIRDTLGHIEKSDMSKLRDKFFNTQVVEKLPCKRIMLDLKTDLKGKAGLHERAMPFGAAYETADTLIDVIDEIKKNAAMLIDNNNINIETAKISDIMMLGILREANIFSTYTSYYFEYFLSVLDGNTIPPYRAAYLIEHYTDYKEILEHVCEKSGNYSFIRDIKVMKKKNADLLLYANKTSFLPFINRKNYTGDDELHIKHGIIGFNFISWLVQKWESWKYNQYKLAQKHSEWLKAEEFRLKQILLEQSPNSPEAKRTKELIAIYSSEISKLDLEISEYENNK